MKLKIWEISLITAIVITLLCGFVIKGEQSELSDKLIRIHVVANSDSDADQALKLEVRDAVLEAIRPLLKDVSDKEAAENILKKNTGLIQSAAEAEVLKQGYAYAVTANITAEGFPTREYDTFSLPAGYYTSLRVVIGTGEGHNWWCVVYPSICTTAALREETAAVNLTDEEVSLIQTETAGYTIKFKIMELFGRLEQLMDRL